MPDIAEPLRSALADRYRIERELGSGGMAIVFVAEDLKHHRQVALKVLRPELAEVLGRERFLREIEIAARLTHPHILPLYDSGEAEGLLFYVMPYVEDESLRDRLKREKQLPVEDAVQISRHVAAALGYAHSHAVVHRDIKPENILLAGGEAVVADFGIARAIGAAGGEKLTRTGMTIGTASYMSPEQASGAADLDGRSDIYSLGCVLYEMLAGEVPFTGPTIESIVRQHLIAEPPPVTVIRAAVPAVVAGVIDKALAKTPADRFATAEMLLNALAAPGPPSSATARPVPEEASKRGWRLPHSVRWVLLGLVLTSAAVAVYPRLRTQRRQVEVLAAELLPVAKAGRLDEVFDRLQAAGVTLSARGIESLAEAAGGFLAIESDPRGAAVELTRVHPIGGFAARPPLAAGETPLAAYSLVAGEYFVCLTHEGTNGVELLVTIGVGERVALSRSLLPSGQGRDGMVLVPAGNTAATRGGATVPAFLIDRYEVTNRAFFEFVSDGGYRNATFWPATMFVDGAEQPWEQAVVRFVDRTGLPGPRAWSGGRYAEAGAEHPAVGVSWYEAAAYARWAGRELPTADQWWRAAMGDRDVAYP